MHVHILGIAGTFMAGVALLAREAGFRVSGCDQGVYPPMSTQLEAQGIELIEGYDPAQLDAPVDLVIVGNALSRGNPLVEHVLEHQLPFTSGPAFVHDHILPGRWVLAVAGTHGKTTTSSMLAWILEQAGFSPGFLIGGIPGNFSTSARLGQAPFFVIEADEYDTAFFDKRSKFVHYSPRSVVLNNLEFDHADIFDDLEAIKRQFEHFVRIIPSSGLIVSPAEDKNLAHVLSRGCWSREEKFSLGQSKAQWWKQDLREDASAFQVFFGDRCLGTVNWSLFGQHNAHNALAAIAAARHAGVPPEVAIEALGSFINARRRMELRGEVAGIRIYDDFAHHPTAIATTLSGLRKRVGKARIIAVLEPRSNTMRMGVHGEALVESLVGADRVYCYRPKDLTWNPEELFSGRVQGGVFDQVQDIVEAVVETASEGDHVVVMSNGGFENIHPRLLDALEMKHGA